MSSNTGSRFLETLVFTTATADGNVAESATTSPVTLTSFAEVARLRKTIVIIITELGV